MANFIFHDNNTFTAYPVPCGDYLLYQIGEMYSKPEIKFEEHEQFCYEITFAIDGVGTSGADVPQVFKKNDCFFSLINEQHQITSDKARPLRFYFFGFSPLPGTSGERYISILTNHIKSIDNRIIAAPQLREILLQLLNEIKHKDTFTNDAIGILISRILIELIRSYENSKEVSLEKHINSESTLIYEIINYLDNNAQTMKNLNEITESFNYSYNYLSALFRKIMPCSMNEYYRKVKMEEAQRLLQEEKLSITETSSRLGYSSIHTFSRGFKQYFGFPPSNINNSL